MQFRSLMAGQWWPGGMPVPDENPPDADWEPLPPLQAGSTRAVQTLVIGGGIVGLACALRLQAAGQQVLLIERERLAAGASRGNAGALAFADVLPLDSPGILRLAPRWLLHPLGPLGPLNLRPAYAPAMLPWLWQFWRASRPPRVAASTQAQAALLAQSAAEWPALLRLAGAADRLRDVGNLHLYDSAAQWRAAQPGWAQRAAHGIACQRLQGADAIAALQPGLNPALRHAVFVPHWQTVDDPLRLCHRLAQAFLARGGRLARAQALALSPEAGGLLLQLGDGSPLLAQFAGLQAAPNYARADAMLAKAQRFLPGLRTEGGTQWMGCRPSLPFIGPSPADGRLFYAFGHGHLGLTQAAATARLATAWATTRDPPPAAFAPGRFLRPGAAPAASRAPG